MTNDNVWGMVDFRGRPLPKPEHWDSNPEWFHADGTARRIPGRRYMEWVFEIHDYRIMEFRQDRHNFQVRDQGDHGRLAYASWCDGARTDLLWESLDKALVDVVRFKYEGRRGSSGHRATEYFMKMVAQESDRRSDRRLRRTTLTQACPRLNDSLTRVPPALAVAAPTPML